MNVLCSDRLLAAVLPSVWYHLIVNGVKSMKKRKSLQVFVHYVIQTSNLIEFVTCIKDIIIGEVNESNSQTSS